MELYLFKEKHPDANLEPFLKKSSSFFQMYIQRGLQGIENERKKSPSPRSSTNISDSAAAHSKISTAAAAAYLMCCINFFSCGSTAVLLSAISSVVLIEVCHNRYKQLQ